MCTTLIIILLLLLLQQKRCFQTSKMYEMAYILNLNKNQFIHSIRIKLDRVLFLSIDKKACWIPVLRISSCGRCTEIAH